MTLPQCIASIVWIYVARALFGYETPTDHIPLAILLGCSWIVSAIRGHQTFRDYLRETREERGKK